MAFDPVGINEAVKTVDQVTIPEIERALHSVLDRLNGAKISFDGSGLVLTIPAKK